MTKLIKDIQRRLITGFMAFFSMFSIAVIRFESNPQDCEMISTQVKKKRNMRSVGITHYK